MLAVSNIKIIIFFTILNDIHFKCRAKISKVINDNDQSIFNKIQKNGS